MSAHSDFFVGIECNANVAVLDFGMCLQIFDGADNFGNAGFIVGAKQGGAIGYHQVVTHEIVHFGELLWVEHDGFFFVEHNFSAFILHHARVHVMSAHIRRSVEVSDKADGGHFFVGVGRQCGHQIAIIVERNVAQAHPLQLFFELLCKHHLPGSGRREVGEFVTLRVILHILEKSVYYFHIVMMVIAPVEPQWRAGQRFLII